MKPDYRRIEPGDPLYDVNVPKWAADAFGIDDLRDVPFVGPDDHMTPTYWSISRIPNDRAPGCRFVAIKVNIP